MSINKIEIQDDNGNVYYPKTSIDSVIYSDKTSIEEKIRILEYRLNNWKEVKKYCNKALKIKTHSKSYINEIFSYDHTIYDLLSLCYYYKNEKYLALYYINKAIEISPNLERLKQNKKIFES